MEKVAKAANIKNGMSRRCKNCQFFKRPVRGVCEICSDSFVEGFKKGANWEKEQLKK